MDKLANFSAVAVRAAPFMNNFLSEKPFSYVDTSIIANSQLLMRLRAMFSALILNYSVESVSNNPKTIL
jgi:hypothetical protein